MLDRILRSSRALCSFTFDIKEYFNSDKVRILFIRLYLLVIGIPTDIPFIEVFCSNCVPIHGFSQEMHKPTRNVNNIISMYVYI